MSSNAITFHRTPLDELVATLTDEERLQILMEGDDFERTGVTGDTLLRQKATEFIPQITGGVHKFDATLMQLLVFSCHKYNSMRMIEGAMRLVPEDDNGPNF